MRPEIRVGSAGGHCGLQDIRSHALECKQTRVTLRWIEKTLILMSYSGRKPEKSVFINSYSDTTQNTRIKIAACNYGDKVTFVLIKWPMR